MRTARGIVVGVVVGSSLAIAGPAFAQESPEVTLEYTPAFDPEQFAASADPEQIALTDGARVATRGTYMAGLIFHVGGPPLDICVRDTMSGATGCQVEGDLVTTRVRADLTFLYGFGRFDVRAALPLVLHQSTDFEPATGQESLGSAGVGDPRIGGRYQIARPGDLAIAADLSFTIPTGGDNFIGDSGLLVDPRVLADWRKDKIAVGASLGYRFRQKAAKLANLYVNDELTWSLGGDYQIQPKKLSAGLALYGRLGLTSPDADPMEMGTIEHGLGAEEFPIEALASARYFVTDKIALDFGAGTALTSGYGAAPFRVLAGVQWVNRKEAPLVVDTDGDGITDDDDKCPREKEDVDGFEDLDGCPERDNDGDGIADASDKCPMDAEDLDGFEDEDGCPDSDNDGDGVADANDKCPTEMEDMDGFQDDDGCPDADNDGDGIADANDKCPTEAETMNGFEDEDGCPDERPSIVVTTTAIEITDKIFFDLNKARIKSVSFPTLDAVADVLKDNAGLRVRVEGHTDDQGEARLNAKLSDQRAAAVKKYLVKKGVDASRLESKGYGFSRPLVPGSDEAARSQNRRVEFVIIERTDGGTAPAPEPAPTPATTP